MNSDSVCQSDVCVSISGGRILPTHSRATLQIRFLVILRDPISRAYSHWQHEHRRGKDAVSSTFAEAIRDELAVGGTGRRAFAH